MLYLLNLVSAYDCNYVIVDHAKVTASAAYGDTWRQFPSTLSFLYTSTGVPVIRVHVTRLYQSSNVCYNVIYEIRAYLILCKYCDDLVSNYRTNFLCINELQT